MTNVSGGNSPKTRSEARAQRLMRCVSRLGPFGALIDIDSSLGSKRYINILYRVYNLQQKQSRRGKKKKNSHCSFFFFSSAQSKQNYTAGIIILSEEELFFFCEIKGGNSVRLFCFFKL